MAAPGVSLYTPTYDSADQSNISAPATEILGTVTSETVGGATPAVVYTRQGVDFDLSCGGANGLDTSSDQFGSAGWATTNTNAQVASATITAFTSPDSGTFPGGYARAGIMLRDSTAAGSKFLAIDYTVNDGNRFVYATWRGTLNGAIGQTYAAGDGSFGSLHIEPVGDGTFRLWRQTAGQAMQLIYTTTLANVTLAASGLFRCFVCSLTANAASASFRQVGLRSSTPITMTKTPASGAHTAELRCTDLGSPTNTSAKSNTTSATPSPTQGIKWNPGHAILVNHTDSTNSDAQIKGYLDFIKTEANFKTARMIFNWRDFEATTQGVYDFTLIRTYRDYINNVTNPGSFAIPKFIQVEVWFEKFGETDPTSGTRALPQWVIDLGLNVGYVITNGHYVAKLTNSSVLTGLQNMYAAMGAAFNSDPWFDAAIVTETSSQSSQNPFRALLASNKTAFPNTVVAVLHNYLVVADTEDQFTRHAFTEYCNSIRVGVGGPDVGIGTYESDGQKSFRGAGDEFYSGYGTVHWGTIDFRGTIPNVNTYEEQISTQTPAQLITQIQSAKTTHMAWSPGYGSSPSTWAQIKAAVNADPTVYTTYPSAF